MEYHSSKDRVELDIRLHGFDEYKRPPIASSFRFRMDRLLKPKRGRDEDLSNVGSGRKNNATTAWMEGLVMDLVLAVVVNPVGILVDLVVAPKALIAAVAEIVTVVQIVVVTLAEVVGLVVVQIPAVVPVDLVVVQMLTLPTLKPNQKPSSTWNLGKANASCVETQTTTSRTALLQLRRI